jgi:hypothetical protein
MTTTEKLYNMNKTLGFLLILIASFSLNAQMDSIRVNMYFEGEVPSPFDSTETYEFIQVDVFIDDFDFFGELLIEVSDSLHGNILAKYKKNAAQVLQEKLLDESVIKSEIDVFAIDRTYKIVARISGFNGAVLFVETRYLSK